MLTHKGLCQTLRNHYLVCWPARPPCPARFYILIPICYSHPLDWREPNPPTRASAETAGRTMLDLSRYTTRYRRIVDTTNGSQKNDSLSHKMQPLQDNIKSEIYYFVKHLAPLGYTFHKLLVHCSPADRRKFEGESKAITRFIENVKRSPRHHKDEVRHVLPTAAPVIAAVHQHLQQHFPERFTKMSSSGSSSPESSSSSSSSSRSGYRRAPKKLDLPPNKARRVVHGEKDLSLVAGLAGDFSGLGLNSRKTDKKKKESAPIALV